MDELDGDENAPDCKRPHEDAVTLAGFGEINHLRPACSICLKVTCFSPMQQQATNFATFQKAGQRPTVKNALAVATG